MGGVGFRLEAEPVDPAQENRFSGGIDDLRTSGGKGRLDGGGGACGVGDNVQRDRKPESKEKGENPCPQFEVLADRGRFAPRRQ